MPGLKDILGLDVSAIDDAAKTKFSLKGEPRGVVITDVAKGSDAERQGLVSGLVISEVNQQKVADVADITDKVDAAREAGRPAVLFKVTDPTGSSRFVAVRLN